MKRSSMKAVRKQRFAWTTSSASATYQIPLTTGGLGTRFTDVSDNYEYFRITDFKARMHPLAAPGAASVNVLALVLDGNLVTPPTTSSTAMECVKAVLLTDEESVPSAWVRANRRELHGPFEWYEVAAASVQLANQGELCVVQSAAAAQVQLEIQFEAEFCVPADPANTPELAELKRKYREMRAKASVDHEREKLLGVLSPASTPKK